MPEYPAEGGSPLSVVSDPRLLAATTGQIPIKNTDGGWAPGPQTPSVGYLSLRNDFALNPSMSASALQTAINSAIVSAISAGKGIDFGADLWPINGPLTVGGSISMRAAGAAEVWGGAVASHIGTLPGAAPWVQGGGIVQQAAGADILQIFATGPTVHLRDMVLAFGGSSAFNNTGHAINAAATAVRGAGHELGLAGPRWDNLVVFGHDGNHYAYYTLNMFYFLASHLRSYGGGGWYEGVDDDAYGNGTLLETYFALICNGTADGIQMNSLGSFPGNLNLVTMVRPQSYVFTAVGTALATAFGITTPPTFASQFTYRDVNNPQLIEIIAPDLENPSVPCFMGTSTTVTGPEYSNRTSRANVSLGVGALCGTPTGQNNTGIGTGAIGAGASVTGSNNTGLGYNALLVNTSGSTNAAVGYQAMLANTTGGNNVAIGGNALAANISGASNVAVGFDALQLTTTVSNMTAVGVGALQNATIGNLTAVGANALQANLGGSLNTAVGYQALKANTTGSNNTAVGSTAMVALLTGAQNTAVGANALATNTASGGCTAVGYAALTATTGASNTAVGQIALNADSTGQQNTGVGVASLFGTTTGSNNSALGYQAGRGVVAGSLNSALGYQAGYTDGTTPTTDGSSMTLIGENAQSTLSNAIVLGKAIATRPNLFFGAIPSTALISDATATHIGTGVFFMANAVAAPAANPVGGGILYVTGGALTYRGSGGTVTTLGPA